MHIFPTSFHVLNTKEIEENAKEIWPSDVCTILDITADIFTTLGPGIWLGWGPNRTLTHDMNIIWPRVLKNCMDFYVKKIKGFHSHKICRALPLSRTIFLARPKLEKSLGVTYEGGMQTWKFPVNSMWKRVTMRARIAITWGCLPQNIEENLPKPLRLRNNLHISLIGLFLNFCVKVVILQL